MEKREKMGIDVFSDEKRTASENRKFLEKNGIYTVNVLGSPGSGKTTFIESIATRLGRKKCLVIEGDLSSKIDSDMLNKKGISSIQINTKTTCHLIPQDIKKALGKAKLKGKEFLFIENIGNLVCPANKDLGENLRLLVSSCPEGSDKPLKYPPMFRFADVVVVSKTDMEKASGFSFQKFGKNALKINGELGFFRFGKKQ